MIDRYKMKDTELYSAGATTRYHTRRMIQRQTVADHSWGVAFVLTCICNPSVELLKAAIFHDLAETVTGDMPATAKWANPAMADALSALEFSFDLQNGLAQELSNQEVDLLKWADALELMLHCKAEISMGNVTAYDMYDRVRERLTVWEAPTAAAASFLKEISRVR